MSVNVEQVGDSLTNNENVDDRVVKGMGKWKRNEYVMQHGYERE